MSLEYRNFDLLIESRESGYRARILSSSEGEASANFTLPFTSLERQNFLLNMGQTRLGPARPGSPLLMAAQNFGIRLFEALFNGPVRDSFHGALRSAERDGVGLRLRLRLSEVPELADIPWEYLYVPSREGFLSLSVETPIVRYLEMPRPVQVLGVEPPLRILVMASSPREYPALDVEGQWQILHEALENLVEKGRVTLTRLVSPTLASLQKELRRGQYHIFHYIGHGRFSEHKEDGMLLLENEQGEGMPVSGQYLGMLLHDERPLRLVILSACEGARTSQADPYAGTAQQLVRQGIPAVIAMQFKISEFVARILSREFYGSIADGYPVDAALAEARKAIFAQRQDIEWGIPVLYMRSPDGQIFDLGDASRAVDDTRTDSVASSRDINITVGGNAGGIILGDNNVLINNIGGQSQVNFGMGTQPASEPPGEPGIEDLVIPLTSLRSRVESMTGTPNRNEILARVKELQVELYSQVPDLDTLEQLRDWFNKNASDLAPEVIWIISLPFVRKMMAAAGRKRLEEYERRFD